MELQVGPDSAMKRLMFSGLHNGKSWMGLHPRIPCSFNGYLKKRGTVQHFWETVPGFIGQVDGKLTATAVFQVVKLPAGT